MKRSVNRQRRRVREAHRRAAARRVALLWCRLLPNLLFRFEAPVFTGIDVARTRCEQPLPPSERDQIYAALRAQLRAGVLVLPRAADLHLVEASGASWEPFDALIRAADAEVSRAILGPLVDATQPQPLPRALPTHPAGDPE